MNTDVELVSKALADFDVVSAGILELRKTYGGVVFDVATTPGMEAARAARATIREPRYRVESIRKEAKAPILALGKKLDADAARITAELLKIEQPIDQQIKSEEERKERERTAKIEAERKRVADIQARIGALRAFGSRVSDHPAVIGGWMDELAATPTNAEQFAEFVELAQAAKDETMAALQARLTAAVAHGLEVERLAAEREELNRLRAEQEARAKAEQAERDAEAAKQAEALRIERERFAAERKAQEEAAAKEAARLQAERKALQDAADAEKARLAAERAEFERQQEAAKPKPAPIVLSVWERPTDAQIAEAVAVAFNVPDSVARGWLMDYGAVAA